MGDDEFQLEIEDRLEQIPDDLNELCRYTDYLDGMISFLMDFDNSPNVDQS